MFVRGVLGENIFFKNVDDKDILARIQKISIGPLLGEINVKAHCLRHAALYHVRSLG